MTSEQRKVESIGDDGGFDSMLDFIGFGRWQLSVMLLSILTNAFYPVHLLGPTLLNAPMSFRCFTKDAEVLLCGSGETNCSNEINFNFDVIGNSSYYDNECLPSVKPQANPLEKNASYIYTGKTTIGVTRKHTSLPSCPYIEYDTSIYESTIVSEFDLVCEQAYIRPLFASVGTIGMIFGSMGGGAISDRWGRVRGVQMGVIANAITVIAMATIPNYYGILVARFLAAGTACAILVASWSFALECTPSRERSLAGMYLGLPFSFFIATLAGIAYYIRIWKYLLLVVSTPSIPLLVFSFLTTESPRWLLQKGRIEEARKVILRATKMNGTEGKLDLDSELKVYEKNVEKNPPPSTGNFSFQSFWKRKKENAMLFFSPAMRTIVFFLGFDWILHNLLYVGISLNANNFTDDPYLYIALSGAMDALAILLTSPFNKWFGRRVILIVSQFTGGIFFFLDLAVPSDLVWLRWVFVMGGFFLIAGSFQVNFMYTPEVFPTEIRARGFAFALFMGNIGASSAPFITDVLPIFYWWGPAVAFGTAGILSGLSIFFLPETKDKPLPETIKELEERHRRRKSREKRNDDRPVNAEEDYVSIHL